MLKKFKFLLKYPSLILIILVIPAFITLVRPGFFPMHDDLQAFRIHQMHECFKDLQILRMPTGFHKNDGRSELDSVQSVWFPKIK